MRGIFKITVRQFRKVSIITEILTRHQSSSPLYLNHQLAVFGMYLCMVQYQKLLNIYPWSKKMHPFNINYFFLYGRRQWASFSDLLILFTVLGLCQWDMASFNPLREKHTYLCPCSSYEERGVQYLQAYAAQWGDLLLSWQPRYSWAVTVCHPATLPIKQGTGIESAWEEVSCFLQLALFHSTSAY